MKRLIFAVSLPLFALDQATKAAVLLRIPGDGIVPVIPGFFNIVHVYNTGAAFGMLKGANGFFIALSVVALAVVATLIRKGVFRDLPSKWGAALLLGGVAGNLTDRILHGHVVDFLDIILPIYGRWPAFNVADSCICLAAALFVLSAFLGERKNPAACL